MKQLLLITLYSCSLCLSGYAQIGALSDISADNQSLWNAIPEGNTPLLVENNLRTPVEYRNIPECNPPKRLKVEQIGSDNFTMSWDGRPAEKGHTEYLIRYRPESQLENWEKILVTEGQQLTIGGLESGIKYVVEIRKICYWKDGSTISGEWVSTSVTPHLVKQRAIICGAPYVYPLSAYACYDIVTDPQTQMSMVYIGDIPIEVDSLGSVMVPGPEGPVPAWSGTGVATLPIADARVRVRWKNVTINHSANKYNICGGKVFGIKDDPANYPDLGSAPAVFGHEICTKPPSAPGFDQNGIHSETNAPWDPHGFGPTGKYVKPPYDMVTPGMPYDSLHDPNGFDANGIHLQTNTKYGPDGCSIEGLTAAGDTCQPGNGIPYYWLKPEVIPEQSTANLLESIKDSLKVWVVKSLGNLSRQYRDSVAVKSVACEGIRTAMRGIVVALNYDETFIFGATDEYLAKGMWKNFKTKPVSLGPEIARDANQVDLEKKHIDLYVCDKKLDELSTLYSLLDSLSKSAGAADELTEAMRLLIAGLPGAKADSFSHNYAALLEWLKAGLYTYVQETYCDGHCYYSPPRLLPAFDAGNSIGATSKESGAGEPRNLLRGSLAANPDINWHTLFNALEAGNQASFLEKYLSGAEYIEGIHRAFYVEALGKARLETIVEQGATTLNATLTPVEIPTRASDGRKYSIWVDNVELGVNYAFLDAYIVLELPNSGQKIAFSGLRLPFTPNGFTSNPARLKLATAVKIRKNNAVEFELKPTTDTYISFDCSGYAGIGLDIDVEVCRDIVKPLNPTNLAELPDPNRVNTNIKIFIPTWDELYAEVNIQPFVITGMEDYKWIVSGIVVDFSDIKSPNYLPPAGYASSHVVNNKFSPLWHGFYINNLSVRMPNQFDEKGAPLTIGVERVVLDHMGVSGQVYATPLLALDKGNAGGWAFSVDTFKLTVLCNQPVNAGFNGLIHIPLFSAPGNNASPSGPPPPIGPADCFRYRAFLERGDGTGRLSYRMVVDAGNQNRAVNMWRSGQVLIKKGSRITMEVADGQFTVLAVLHGKVKIDRPLSRHINLNIPDITFENLTLGNTAPYFKGAGVWAPDSTDTGLDFGGFKINLNHVSMTEQDSTPALTFDVGVKISDDSVGLSATGGFRILGRLDMDGQRQRWEYNTFSVNSIDLDGSMAGIGSVKGTLKFFEGDTVFGTGWRGGVSMIIKQLGSVSAVAQFGRIKQPRAFRYFFIDGLVCLSRGIGGAIQLKGFGGGVFHHMNRPAASMPLSSGCSENPSMPAELGASLSGLIYTPDPDAGLGFKATVALATAVKENAFNANATLQLLFNNNGGLSDLWIYGNARFMSDPDLHRGPDPNPSNNSAISGTVDIHLNFNEDALSGDITVNINAGGGKLYGGGTALIHADSKKWFIKIGTPVAPLLLGISIPFADSIGKIQSYMEIGNDIDPMPPLPADIATLLKKDNVPFPTREGASLAGFAFGANLSVDRKFEVKPLYGNLKILIGFDMSLVDYGSGSVCGGATGPIGINGWYARGQMYAGVWAELGIRVKVFGKRKQFNIASIAAGLALEAGLPNPFWAEGAFAAEFNVLGGMVKGRCDFKFNLGEPCLPPDTSGVEAEVNIIQNIRPADGARAVAVNAAPEVSFNFPIGKAFQLEDPNGNLKYYHAALEAVKLRYRGVEYGGTLQWADDKRSVKLTPEWILPARDTVEVVARVRLDSSGVTIQTEEKVTRFVTGPGLDYIPTTNVTGSWPANGQYNFYPRQLDRPGYIQLKQGQPDLFYRPQNVHWVVRFQQNCGPVGETTPDYDVFNNRITFPLPDDFFAPGAVYRMQLIEKGPGDVATPTGGATTAARFVSAQNCPPERADPAEKVLYTAYFRASQYTSFGAKLSAWSAAQTTEYVASARTLVASAAIEPFDEPELNRINLYAAAGNSAWYTNIKNVLYSIYPNCNGSGPKLCPDATARYWGAEPLKAVRWIQNAAQTPPAVTRQHWLEGEAAAGNATLQLYYEVDYAVNSDYLNARQQIFSYLAPRIAQPNACPQLTRCECYTSLAKVASNPPLTTAQANFACYADNVYNLPVMPAGTYQVVLRYRMPGTQEWGAEQLISITKPGN